MEDDLKKQISMPYDEQVEYLKMKYGTAKYDYYYTKDCKSKNKKVTRTNEGLFCHHIFEGKYGYSNLGEPHLAKIFPFECQKKENLVYCDYLEHLLLHLKICINKKNKFEKVEDIHVFFGGGGFFMIAFDLNYLYMNGGCNQAWRNNCYHKVQNNFEDYVHIIRGVFCFVESNFSGKKNTDFEIDDQIIYEIIDYDSYIKNEKNYKHKEKVMTVKKIEKSKDLIVLENEAKNLLNCCYQKIKNRFCYKNVIEKYKNDLSSYGALYGEPKIWEIMRDFLEKPFDDEDYMIAEYMNNAVNN